MGGYLTIPGLVEEYEAALGKRNKLAINGGLGGRGVKNGNMLENNETEKAIAIVNAPPDALANEKLTGSNSKANAPEMLKQMQNPLSSSLSISLTDKDNDNDTRENIVGGFQGRRKAQQKTGPTALSAFLPQISDEDSINSKLEAVFNKHHLPFPLDLHLVHSWIEGGAEFNRDILPAIKGVCERIERRLLKPPTSFAYFQEAVAAAALKNSPE